MKIEKNISLKKFNTFKVGGNADFFCRVSSISFLKEAINFAKKNNLPFFILGGGSNILVSDKGFRGLVIKIEIKGIIFKDKNKKVFIEACAGESWDELVTKTIKKNLFGIENLSFIPGTIGGAVSGNIGAYGSEIKDVIVSVEVFDIKRSKIIILNKNKCNFEYRDSIFKKNKNYIVIKAHLCLFKKKKLNLSYKDLKEYFKNKDKNPLIGETKEVRKALKKIRGSKFPSLSKYGTAGSFFKNPSINGEKIHLAKVLDDMGFGGFKTGGVKLYKKQPLVVVNINNANAKEIKNFTDIVVKKVFEKIKIKIKPEIIFVGEF